MKPQILISIFTAVFTLTFAWASDDPTLDTAKSRMQDEVDAANLQYELHTGRLLQTHKDNLDRLASQLLQENDAEGALEARLMLSRLNQNQPGNRDGIKNNRVIAAIEWHHNQLQNLENDNSTTIRPILTRYHEGANVMMRRSIEANQVEEALAWRTWRDDLANTLAELPQQDEVVPVSQDPQTTVIGAVRRQLVFYNQNNSHFQGRGAKDNNIILYYRNREVWRQENFDLIWRKDRAEITRFDLPFIRYDRIRVEFINWHGQGAGLSEIRLFDRNQNILKNEMLTLSASLGERYGKPALTDGVLNSNQHGVEYWLLPASEQGWLQINL